MKEETKEKIRKYIITSFVNNLFKIKEVMIETMTEDEEKYFSVVRSAINRYDRLISSSMEEIVNQIINEINEIINEIKKD